TSIRRSVESLKNAEGVDMTSEYEAIIQKEIDYHANEARKRGMEEGRAEGRAEGMAEAKVETSKEIAANMKKQSIPFETISICTGLSVNEIAFL
ncbi:MAG: hypothetical protein K6G51_00245, partial [Sphaerochaetaceae bacterium]|nr:hypothetical protein [Sphaerochaetaceae bacterium]